MSVRSSVRESVGRPRCVSKRQRPNGMTKTISERRVRRESDQLNERALRRSGQLHQPQPWIKLTTRSTHRSLITSPKSRRMKRVHDSEKARQNSPVDNLV